MSRMPDIDPIFTEHAQSMPWLRERTIFITRHGSWAYGTNTESSDEDFKGIAIPPPEYFLGFQRHFEQAECHKPDAVVYDIRKFFALATDANPNILEVLFTDPDDHLIVHPVFKLLLDNRDLFLSKKAKHTFAGFAFSQMRRINLHYRWLSQPPKAPPRREDYGLRPENEMTAAQRDNLGTALAMVDKEVATWHDLEWTSLDEPQRIALRNHLTDYLGRMSITQADLYVDAARRLGMDDNLILLLQREKEYKGAKATWDSYQTWLKSRNPQRAELEAKWGYDTKHAGHLYRLLTMCREILTEGKVIVKRPDREQILAIRNGAWRYEELVEWAERQDKELDEVYKTSKLPHAPDRDKLDRLCQDMVARFNHV